MPVIGTARVKLVNSKNSKIHCVEFTIVDGDDTPLLGSSMAQQMELLTVQYKNILNTVAESTSLAQQKESVVSNNYPGDLKSIME